MHVLLITFFLISSAHSVWAQCSTELPLWANEKDGVRHVVYGTDGVSYGSTVTLEEWREGSLMWRTRGQVTCSNGASICYLILPNESGTETDVVVETIDDNADDVPEWVVLSALSQSLNYVGGAKVEWHSAKEREKATRITPPNIYKLSACRVEEQKAPVPSELQWSVNHDNVTRSDQKRKLMLGQSFGRDIILDFMEDMEPDITYTEGEDCNQCFWVSSGDKTLFIDSYEGKVTLLKVSGPGIFDEFGLSSGQKMPAGMKMYCEDGMDYETCYRDAGAENAGYIIDYPEDCNSDSAPLPTRLRLTIFLGCETLSGFSLSNH